MTEIDKKLYGDDEEAPTELKGLAGAFPEVAEEIRKEIAEEVRKGPKIDWSATLRSHTFIHDQGDPARWESVIDMVYRDRNRLISLSRSEPTAVMINREEQRHCIAWLRRSGQRSGAYQHAGVGSDPGGDDRMFNLPVFWAAPGSMRGQAVRVLTDHSQRS